MSKIEFDNGSKVETIDSHSVTRGNRANMVHLVDENRIVWELNTKNKTRVIIGTVDIDYQ